MAKNKSDQEEKRQRASYGITAEEFVRVWQSCSSASEVVSRLNMPLPIVHARASGYRKAGVHLKSMPRNRQGGGLDVEALNRLITAAAADSKGFAIVDGSPASQVVKKILQPRQ